MTQRGRALLPWFFFGVVAGCARKETPPSPAKGSAPRGLASAQARAEHEPSPGLSSVPALEKARCRALRVKGSVTLAREPDTKLSAMTPLEGEWLELESGAEVVVRHALSAREFTLRGPGVLLPCHDGKEELLVESGSFESSPGTGVRPGAEVWLGTPFGTARYSDAHFTLVVAAKDWRFDVKSGTVWTEPRVQARGRPTDRVVGGEHAEGRASANLTELRETCKTRTERAREAAEALRTPGAGELGKRAAAQFELRRSARSACLWQDAAAERDRSKRP